MWFQTLVMELRFYMALDRREREKERTRERKERERETDRQKERERKKKRKMSVRLNHQPLDLALGEHWSEQLH